MLAFWNGREGNEYYIGGTDVLPTPLTREEEAQVLSRLDTDPHAADILIQHNLRLVVYIAKKFESTGIGIEDLISIGTIGLIKAIHTYKRTKTSSWLHMPPGASRMRFSCISARMPPTEGMFPLTSR